MAEYQLAEINVARMKGVNIDDPIMKEFVDNLDSVNALAERSEGFVWRLKDDANSATSFNPYNDEQVIINISVWQSIESLENYVFKTFHTDFLRRRKNGFKPTERCIPPCGGSSQDDSLLFRKRSINWITSRKTEPLSKRLILEKSTLLANSQ